MSYQFSGYSYNSRARVLFNLLILTIFTVFASATGFAFGEVHNEAPVLPGTKIVEGEKDQNEFYVIAADDTETLREVLRQTELKKMQGVKRSPELNKIELALNDVLEHAVAKHRNFKPRIHYAAHHKKLKKPTKKLLAYNAKENTEAELES